MHRFRILGSMLLLAACKGGDGTGPNRVDEIVVTPGQAVLTAAGATQQFTARAVNEEGGTVQTVITWRSSDPQVVRVEPTGVGTAVFEGSASVIAEADGVSGQAEVLVDIPDCTSPQVVQLQPGGVLVTDPPASATCALTLPAGAPGDRYRVAIVRVSPAVDAAQTPTATLRLTPRGVVTAPPAAALAPSEPLFSAREQELLDQAARRVAATEAAHLRLREAEAALLSRMTAFHRMAPMGLATDGPLKVSPAKRTFVPRTAADLECKSTKTPVAGVLVAQSAELAIYQDSAQAQLTPIATANAQRMIDFYTSYGKATIDSYFGAVPDRDGNGQVLVFVTSEVRDPIAAFVWGGDQLAKSLCPASNEAELVYFNPSLVHGLSQGNHQALETLVHEVKHVVSFSQRIQGAFAVTHPGWIEEGSAEVAGEAASRRAWAAVGGPPQNGVVTRQSFQVGITPQNYGIAVRLNRTTRYLSWQPNAVVVATSGVYSIYGSGWHFHRFLGDAYGAAASAPGADAGLFLQQNQGSTPAGLGGLNAVTQKSFAELMVDYAGAVMLSGFAKPTHAFSTYDFPSATSAIQGAPAAPYPYPVTASGSNPSAPFATGTWSGAIGNGGLRIHDFVSSGTASAEITVQVEPPARVVVARLR